MFQLSNVESTFQEQLWKWWQQMRQMKSQPRLSSKTYYICKSDKSMLLFWKPNQNPGIRLAGWLDTRLRRAAVPTTIRPEFIQGWNWGSTHGWKLSCPGIFKVRVNKNNKKMFSDGFILTSGVLVSVNLFKNAYILLKSQIHFTFVHIPVLQHHR